MLDDPGLDTRALTAAIREAWGLDALAYGFIRGYDMRAASYAVETNSGRVFLKVHLGPVVEVAVDVPRALVDAGVPNILAATPTLSGDASFAMHDDWTLVLSPFIAGRTAMVVGLDTIQWRTFGSTLRAVHDSPTDRNVVRRLPIERFDLPSADALRRALRTARRSGAASPAQARLASLLRAEADRIETMLARALALGSGLRGRRQERVLCHGDIHAANVLVSDDGTIRLIDWDGARFAPRERDLLFVIGSRIARDVQPHEEASFFEGYGEVAVDPDAIVYFRLERIVEDLGEIWRSVFEETALDEASRATEVDLAESFFGPDGIVETAEAVVLRPAPISRIAPAPEPDGRRREEERGT
jgi:spectinomycin phosphotransferase